MKRRIELFTIFVFPALIAAFCSTVNATTWDEPWHEEVVRTADLFARVKIKSNANGKATAEILKILSGNETSKIITLQNYSMLRLASLSDRGELALPYKVDDEYFLLVKRDPKTGSFQTPTPPSGWAWVDKGNVYATYRHSYHKALVPVDIYERTTLAIFQALHGDKSISSDVQGFIKQALFEPPADLNSYPESESSKRFFRQHVALETFAYIGVGADLSTLTPFIETAFPQVQISAARAISKIDSSESTELLMKTIEGKKIGFAKIMCIWGLERRNARNMTPRLQAYLKTGYDEQTGFGGSIMDPRVGTVFPGSVKESIRALLDKWKVSIKTAA